MSSSCCVCAAIPASHRMVGGKQSVKAFCDACFEKALKADDVAVVNRMIDQEKVLAMGEQGGRDLFDPTVDEFGEPYLTKRAKSIYCVHPISGLTPDEVFTYYTAVRRRLSRYYDVLIPMTGKISLRCAKEFRAEGNNALPITTNHAIFERDRWMVTQADIIYANLIGATARVSIGSMFELAWASLLGKYVVLAMDQESVHRHAFVLEAADVVFTSDVEAEDYLVTLAKGAI